MQKCTPVCKQNVGEGGERTLAVKLSCTTVPQYIIYTCNVIPCNLKSLKSDEIRAIMLLDHSIPKTKDGPSKASKVAGSHRRGSRALEAALLGNSSACIA